MSAKLELPADAKLTIIGGYNAAGDFVPLLLSDDGSMASTATLVTGDLEIGAVELQDEAGTNRANIKAANTARTTATMVIAVQHVDAAGLVLPASPVLGAGSAIIGGTVRRVTLTNKSNTANGSSQVLSALNASRNYFSFQNPSTNMGTMWVDPLGGTAVAGSPCIEVKPGQGFGWSGEAVPTNAMTVIGTNGEKWIAHEG